MLKLSLLTLSLMCVCGDDVVGAVVVVVVVVVPSVDDIDLGRLLMLSMNVKSEVSEVGGFLDVFFSCVVVAVLPLISSLLVVSCYRFFLLFAAVYRAVAGRHRGDVGGEEKHPRQARLRVAS